MNAVVEDFDNFINITISINNNVINNVNMRSEYQNVELNIFLIYENVNNIAINNLLNENFAKVFNKYIIKLNLKIIKSIIEIIKSDLKIIKLMMKIIKSDLNVIKSNLNAIKYLFIIFKKFN